MTTLPTRDTSEAETPFHAPEALAMAMPLIAVFGLILVVSALALGASGQVVALFAVAGFGLCAIAPMALIEAFVTRPLRAALAQLRDARDGRSARGRGFASGVLADLVDIARDIEAAQAKLTADAAFAPLGAGDSQEALRALRQQAEALAEAAAEGESQINRAAQTCFADIAQALKTMRDAPVAAGFEGAVERLESMLVYIAEAQERAEAKDRQFEGAFGRVEVGMADLARLVARETETVQGALSSHGRLARNDIADAAAQEKNGRARVLERIDTLETRLAKGAKSVAGDVARLDEIVVALARVEAEIAQALARPAVPEALDGLGSAVARLAQELAAREPMEPALRAMSQTLAAQFEAADFPGLRAQMQKGAHAPVDSDAQILGALAEIGARLDALGCDTQANEMVGAAQGLIQATARLDMQRLGALPETLGGIVAREIAEVSARLDAQGEAEARRLEALGARMDESLLALARAASTPENQPPGLVEGIAQSVAALDGRLDAALAHWAAQGETARHMAETVESALAEVAARTETAAQRQSEKLDDFAEETIHPARDALAGAARDFAAARARLEASAPVLARVEQAAQDARVQIKEAGAQWDALAASLPRALAETAEAQAERLLAHIDAAALAPARDALGHAQAALAQATDAYEPAEERHAQNLAAIVGATADLRRQIDAMQAQAVEGFSQAQGRLVEVAAKIETGDARLAVVDRATGELGRQLEGLAQTLRAQGELDAGALAPARKALTRAAEGFAAAQGRLAGAVDKIEAGDPRVAAATTDLRERIDALAAALRTQADQMAERLDAATLAPARDALAQATQSFAAAQVRLTQAAAQVEAGDLRLAQWEDAAEAMRAKFAAVAQSLPERLAQVGAAGLDPAREALTEAARAFEGARARLDGEAESLALMRGDFVASEARFARLLDETVARLAAVADKDARGVDALRDGFANAEREIAALAGGWETTAAALGERIVLALAARDRDGAPSQGRAPEGLDSLRGEIAASAQTVASGFHDALQALARQIDDRLEGLRRGEFMPALALQASAQDLGNAHAEMFSQVDALKGALADDRAAFAALRLDMMQAFANVAGLSERADASMREAAERSDTLSQNVSALAGAERAELAALAQALARIGERVEYAAHAFEDRRGGDFATLGADLTREIDALARATAERVLALEGGVKTLAHAAGATLSQLREATRTLGGVGLSEIVRRLDPIVDLPRLLPDLTRELSGLGARAALLREGVERQLPAQAKAAPLAAGAVVNLVVSMAEALDARFSQIEGALTDLSARLVAEEPDRLQTDAAALTTQLNAASRALKAGLSDFVGISAALVEEIGGRPAGAPPSVRG